MYTQHSDLSGASLRVWRGRGILLKPKSPENRKIRSKYAVAQEDLRDIRY